MSGDAPADPDILRAARRMIEQHGQRTAWQAEARVAELSRMGSGMRLPFGGASRKRYARSKDSAG
jgi:hypothetical protein